MNLIPIQKAFDASSYYSAYIFSCPYRNFPVIISYPSLNLLAEINKIKPVLSLLDKHELEFFDKIECGVHEDRVIGKLYQLGYTISRISKLTYMQPLEIAMYYSGLVSVDEITVKIMLERTGNLDIQPDPVLHYYGELVSDF